MENSVEQYALKAFQDFKANSHYAETYPKVLQNVAERIHTESIDPVRSHYKNSYIKRTLMDSVICQPGTYKPYVMLSLIEQKAFRKEVTRLAMEDLELVLSKPVPVPQSMIDDALETLRKAGYFAIDYFGKDDILTALEELIESRLTNADEITEAEISEVMKLADARYDKSGGIDMDDIREFVSNVLKLRKK